MRVCVCVKTLENGIAKEKTKRSEESATAMKKINVVP